jgi:hypothetical protein
MQCAGALLLFLFAAFPTALDGGFGRCCLAAATGYFHVAQNEGSPNCLLAKGMPGGKMKQLFAGAWFIMPDLMYQCSAHHARPECHDDVGVSHPQELMTLLKEALNVISERFT